MEKRDRQRAWLAGGIFIALLTLMALIAVPGHVAEAQDNLLVNPSFEGGYSTFDPEPDIPDCSLGVCTTAQMAAGWWPWWVSQQASDQPWENRMPEYKPATAPFANRIHSGATAQQYFTFHSTHTAGLWQRVQVPTNANLTFSIWGHAWSSPEDGGTSVFPTPVNMRIGIDPTGGTNPFSGNIVWSPVANVYDVYAQFSVSATAQGDFVTVFTYSKPQEARKHNDIYWDTASLVASGIGAPPPAPAPSGGGASSAPPAAPRPVGPTPTPDAEGVITYIVQAGDTLWSIAARAGLTLDELLELNNLSRSQFIIIGDRLILGFGEPGGAEEAVAEAAIIEEEIAAEDEAAAASEPAPTATSLPTPTATPAVIAAVAVDEKAAASSSLCLMAFVDDNENGVQDGGEALRDAVGITIVRGTSVVSNYITDGAAEPYCIEGLEPGTYRVTRSKLVNEVLTTPGDWAVTLTEGGRLDIEFGSIVDNTQAAALTASSAAAPDTAANAADAASLANNAAAAEASDSSLLNGVVIAVVVLAVLLLVAVLVIVFSARRSAA